MKKLDEQLERIKSIITSVNEQDRRTMRAANAEFSCRAHPRSELRKSAKGGGGSSEEEKVLSQWETFANSDIDKTKLNTLKTSNDNVFKTLSSEDADTVAKAAILNSETFNRLNANYSKYFENGKLKPNLQPRDIGYPELIFLKQYFPSQETITPTDILNLFSQKLGGIQKYKEIANNFYKL